MILSAKKSRLSGTVAIPGSKSHTIRAVAVASLAEGDSAIMNPLISGDALSSVAAYRALGAEIDTSDDKAWKVRGLGGRISATTDLIDVGNSGTTLRIASGSAALSKDGKAAVFTGDHQIQSRPIAPLLNSLNDLGAKASSIKGNDMAPISISGTLRGGKTTIECVTSQYLSSLLPATPLAEKDTEISVTLLNEPDYVKMTIDWLDKQGIVYTNDNLRHLKISGGQKYRAFAEPIAADFSSATFFLCAGAMLESDISVTGLDFTDSQPDKAVAVYLKDMGADLSVQGGVVKVKGSRLKGIDIDMNRTPDALPAMAVVGAFAEGTTRLLNVPQARKKETDRIAVMAKELARLGARTEELPDGLVIHGGGKLKPCALNGYYDHRVVMALSLVAMALDGECTVDTAEAIGVTFPEYVELMRGLGAKMETRQ